MGTGVDNGMLMNIIRPNDDPFHGRKYAIWTLNVLPC